MSTNSVSLNNVSHTSDVPSTTTAATQELGQDAFLNLLVTQLQNQDPLNPQENGEFIAQLAQFSQVEQLTNANDALGLLYQAMASMNNASMTQLLGKNIRAFGDTFHYEGAGSTDILFDATDAVATATLTIQDENGKVVYSTEMGPLEEGEGSYTWDGNSLSGGDAPEGDYTFSITARDSDGNEVVVQEIIEGEIDGMSFESGTPVPSIRGVEVSLADIIFVSTAEDAAEEDAREGSVQ